MSVSCVWIIRCFNRRDEIWILNIFFENTKRVSGELQNSWQMLVFYMCKYKFE